jgi:hypothetical protein
MATQSTTIVAEVTDNGTVKKLIKDVQELRATADQAAASTAKLGGGTTGSRKLAAENTNYGTQRGSAGQTGASARDFANEAQGLGGLVRLYATYAANIFAVGAAFRALSNAMDTSNMVKGLDQLGAASGKNLGSLSKRLVDITDGAISMRESLQAVAQTSTGGISSKNIERLAAVAKNASQTLGVAMPDAISRLSRGITKLEPELLDELGIMTKIGPATQDYARNVGKAVSQLTDFERRQAFANAVLTEGEKKFGDIKDIASNPYDKLLSSLKNVSQAGLEVLNKFLTPIVSLLATSPTALATGIGLIASLLIKQALPALTHFKEGLESGATKAKKAADARAADATAAQVKISKMIEDEVEKRADKEVAAVDAAANKIKALQEGGIKKTSAAYKILQKDIHDVTDADLKRLETSARGLDTRGLTEQAKVYRELVGAVTQSKKAEEEFIKVKAAKRAEIEADAKSSTSIYGLTQKVAVNAQIEATKKGIIANAAYNGSLVGVGNAYKLMRAEIDESGLKLNAWSKGLLVAKGSAASVMGALGALSGVLSSVMGIFGVFATVISLINEVFSSNSKEMDKFNSSLETASDTVASANKTLEYFNKQGGFASASIEGVSALASAFAELSDTATNSVANMKAAKEASGKFDQAKDWVASMFGGGLDKNLATSLGKTITSAIDVLSKASPPKEVQAKFQAILGIDNLDTESITAAIAKLSDAGKEQLVESLDKVGKEFSISASRASEFKAALDGSKTAFDTFLQSTASSDPLFKLGASIQTLGTSMQKLTTGNAREVTAAIEEMAKSPEKLLPLGADLAGAFNGIKDGLKDQLNLVGAYDNGIAALTKDIKKMEQAAKDAQEQLTTGTGVDLDIKDSKELIEARKSLSTAKEARAKLEVTVLDKGRELFTKAMSQAFKEGADYIAKATGQAQQQAALAIAKAQAGALTGPRAAAEEGRITQQELSVQIEAINTNTKLILATEKLSATIDQANAEAALTRITAKKASGEATDSEVKLAQANLNAAKVYRSLITDTKIKEYAPTAGTPEYEQALVKSKVSPAITRIAQQEASRTVLQGQSAAASINTQRNVAVSKASEATTDAGAGLKQVQAESARLKILESIAGLTSGTLTNARFQTEEAAIQLKNIKELAEYDTRINNTSNQAEKARQTKLRDAAKALQDKETEQRKEQNILNTLTLELEAISKRYELKKAEAALEDARKTAELDLLNAQVTGYASLYDITSGYGTTMQASLDRRRAELELTKATAAAEADMLKKREDAAARKVAVNNDPKAVAGIDEELAFQQQLTDAAVASAKIQYDSKVAIIEVTKQLSAEQNKYNEILSTTASFGESLKVAFGGIGTSIGDVATAMATLAVSSDKGSKALEAIDKSLSDFNLSGAERSKLDTARAKQVKKNEKDELTGMANIVGGTKKLFKEKTGAYKVLNTIEKAMHMERLVMDGIELAQTLATVGAKVTAFIFGETAKTTATQAGFMSRMGTYIAETFFSVTGQLGIFGPIVAAGIVAAILAMVGGGGGGGASMPSFTPTSEQRQATQGTGQSYDSSGNLVDNNSGVFGDSSAKTDSINKSLEIIKNTSVEGLNYNNKMLKALNKIADAVTGAAQSIYSVQGLRAGTNFGTQAAETASGGGIIASIFGGGKSVSTSITSAGVKLTGTLEDLANNIGGAIQQYKDVQTITTKKGGWFSKGYTRTTMTEETQSLEASVTKAISEVYKNSRDMFLSIGEQVGITAKDVTSVLGSMNATVNIDLMGLTGDEVLTELNAVMSSQLNAAASILFSQFEEFRKFGEGYLETVVRVVDASSKVKQALSNIGVTEFSKIVGMQLYYVSDALVKLAGDLSTFIDQANYYSENFLTSAEKLAPTEKAVTAELARLAVAMNDSRYATAYTKQQFKDLVSGLDLTTTAGQEAYQALMDIAPGFESLISSSTDLAAATKSTLTDLVSSIGSFITNITTFKASLVLSASSTLTPAQKYAETKAQLDAMYAGVLAGDTASQDKFTSTAQAFLDASKNYNASSEAYTTDYLDILSKLDTAQTAATSQLSNAQLQLKALDSQISILQSIDYNIASLTGGTAVQAFATGGLAIGKALVGENGPEFVDFKTPGRVYTADQTAGMFTGTTSNEAMAAVVAELREVKSQLAQLRSENRKQAGDIIISNYDANEKNANAVSEAIVATATDANWNERNQVTIK